MSGSGSSSGGGGGDGAARVTGLPPPWNTHLPRAYVDKLEDEGNARLADLTAAFAAVVVTGDVTSARALTLAADELFELGYEFSLRQRTDLVKVLLEIIYLEPINYVIQGKVAKLVCRVLDRLDVYEKLEDDLVVPWSKLYRIIQFCYFEEPSVSVDVNSHGKSMAKLTMGLRRYFAPTAEDEILAELLPYMCVHDSMIYEAFGFLALLVPTYGSTDPAPKWLDTLFALWELRFSNDYWHGISFDVIARLSQDSPYVDWKPYETAVFNYALKQVAVPVGTGKTFTANASGFPARYTIFTGVMQKTMTMRAFAKWVVYALRPASLVDSGAGSEGGGAANSVLNLLAKFMNSLEQYFHPSNSGNWSPRLGQLIDELCRRYCERLELEAAPECVTPPHLRLDESTTSEFVSIVFPMVLLGRYSKNRTLSEMSSAALSPLSHLCPDVVLPQLLDTIYPALETLTSSHQTVAALSTLECISGALLDMDVFPEGPGHLANLLRLATPGIDLNDPRKTQNTLGFFIAVVSRVPLIDATELPCPSGLSEHELAARQATGEFTNWVAVVLDQVFFMVEQLPTINEAALGYIENATHALVTTALYTLFRQMGSSVYDFALGRVFAWFCSVGTLPALSHASSIIGACAVAYPKKFLAKFFPVIRDAIKAELASGAGTTYGKTDSRLLWNIHVLSRVISRSQDAVLDYRAELLELISLCLETVKEKTVVQRVGDLAFCLMSGLTSYYTLDRTSVPVAQFEDPEWQATHWRSWGKNVDHDALQVEWFEPTAETLEFAQEVFQLVLDTVLPPIQSAVAGESVLTKEEWFFNLTILRAGVKGGSVLMADESEDDGGDSRSDSPTRLGKVVIPKWSPFAAGAVWEQGADDAIVQAGRERRTMLAELIVSVIDTLSTKHESDTVAIGLASKITSLLLCFRGVRSTQHSSNMALYKIKKKLLHHPLKRRSLSLPRSLLVYRAHVQHELRLATNSQLVPMNSRNRALIDSLFRLSVAPYSAVRSEAQKYLFQALRRNPLELTPLLEKSMALLADADTADHTFTGSIYVLCGSLFMSRIVRNWHHSASFVSAFMATAARDETVAQTRLYDLFVKWLGSAYMLPTRAPEPLCESSPEWVLSLTDSNLADYDDIRAGADARAQQIDDGMAALEVNGLTVYQSQPTLHWRYQNYLVCFINRVVRSDRIVSPGVLNFFLDAAVSDIAAVRRACYGVLERSIRQLRPHSPRPPRTGPGDRLSPQSFASLEVPSNAAEWEAAEFLDKMYLGWAGWHGGPSYGGYPSLPSPRGDAAATAEAVAVARTAVERRFTDEAYVASFVGYLENREIGEGASGWYASVAKVFREVFEVVGIEALPALADHLSRLTAVTGASQRAAVGVATAVVGGLLRGSRWWPYADLTAMWDEMSAALREAFDAATPETLGDWCTALRFAVADRDPRRFTWLAPVLLDSPLDPGLTSLRQANNLSIIYHTLNEYSWRGLSQSTAFAGELASSLWHPYKQVRERVAQAIPFLATTFMEFDRVEGGHAIQFRGTVGDVAGPAAGLLANLVAKINELGEVEAAAGGELGEEDETDLKNARKTLIMVLYQAFSQSNGTGLHPVLCDLLPLVFDMLDETDVLVSNGAKGALSYVSTTLFPDTLVPQLLNVLEVQATSRSWHCRAAVLPFLQQLAFRHLFILDTELLQRITDLLVTLIGDEQVEVRALTSPTLAGILKVADPDILLGLRSTFSERVATKLRKRRRKGKVVEFTAEQEETFKEALRVRHSGVLGLGAIVKAYPYTVPEWMPEVLVELSARANDPMPISASVRDTFTDFWRTHRDTWHATNVVFTPEQLEIVNELLVSPSYYA